jgi:hypothetical protein
MGSTVLGREGCLAGRTESSTQVVMLAVVTQGNTPQAVTRGLPRGNNDVRRDDDTGWEGVHG